MQLAGIGPDGVRGRDWGLGSPWLDLDPSIPCSPWSQPDSAVVQFLVGMVREIGGDAQLPHRVWDVDGSRGRGRASSKQDRHE